MKAQYLITVILISSYIVSTLLPQPHIEFSREELNHLILQDDARKNVCNAEVDNL